MRKASKSKKAFVAAVLMMSLTFSGLASAADMKTIKKDGMELVQLRQAAKMYGYSIMWDSKDRSVTLMYMGKTNEMMKDDMMKKDDSMMKDNMMKEEAMMPAAKTIQVWVGSKKMMVDGMQVNLKSMPLIYEGNTYVSDMVVSKYMEPMKVMK
ncbi:copper amine oxidase N-terminal domain-containing protein [Paenibacillus barcinonensis]|uniref:copper amine oxidase N-terminal domain-containing protein n=1 Tax=Paenibacillus barcinonensis TaxID=198119 RepID=UPI001C1135D4|nr:copper amine oxidase N-terminal domain-containing protein [Paenibacillus barcinonensis]MBU5351196.1 copper amine oxidase N-terminal domain-containing protein [Paenibacillus barcinonensis]